MKPVIALVGRPNVGKSTLFNRLTRTRDAIVADFAGLTRDRHYGDGHQGGREFIVIDTGGFEPEKPTGIVAAMARQTQQAVAEADVVVFVVDARSGVSGQDHDIARYLRTANKRVVLAVNKAEGMLDAPQLAEFHELGMKRHIDPRFGAVMHHDRPNQVGHMQPVLAYELPHPGARAQTARPGGRIGGGVEGVRQD